MVTVVAQDGRTAERLPYEIFHPEQAAAMLAAVRARYHIDPNSIVSTGISLGSNFSIAFAAAHPDWFSAIVPVSTEGESRELVLRNLLTVPTYVLEGTQDRNIRGVDGPRALAEIMESFGYDIVYREFSDRAHEGFQEHYGDVLRWLADRPRNAFPVELVRVPLSGIMPLSRRIHWLETDTRQAVVRAAVRDGNRIEVSARWAGEITLYLHDSLVDLDRPLEIWVNGVLQYDGRPPRSVPDALQRVRQLGDESRVYPAAVTVQVPGDGAPLAAARQLTEVDLAPRRAPGTLSFWEMYAVRALEERFPGVGFAANEVALPAQLDGRPEQVGLRVTEVDGDGAFGVGGLEVGDVVIEVDGEPFFDGRGGVAALRAWLMRELRSEASDYPVTMVRRGRLRSMTVSLTLGPYAGPAGPAR
jgi:pimeloyl-ACP methyl ester carboxylesterase